MARQYTAPLTGKKYTLLEPALQRTDGCEKIYLVENSSNKLQFMWFIEPNKKMWFSHKHTFLETIEILEGTITLLKPFSRSVTAEMGRTVIIKPGQSHQPANFGQTRLAALVTQMPNADVWYDLETMYGLAKAGKSGPDGHPSFKQLVVLGHNNPTSFLPGLPIVLQKWATKWLAPLFIKAGTQAHYLEYQVTRC